MRKLMSKFADHIWSTICQQAQSKKVFSKTFTEQVSYVKLKQIIEKLSEFFQQNNSPKKIAIMSGNDQFVAQIVLACTCNDITYTVMDKEAKPHRVNALLSQFAPDITFIDEEFTAEGIAGTIVNINPSPSSTVLNKLLNKLYSNKVQDTYPGLLNQIKPSSPKSAGKCAAYILFTSGTTAAPKGVVISNSALMRHLSTIKGVFSYNSDSQILNSLNLSHADGLVQGPVLVAYLGAGWSSIGQYKIAETERIFDIITAHQASHFITVPIVLSLIDKLAKYDDAFCSTNFKTIVSTGGHLDKQTWINIERNFNTKVSNMYGLTETTTGGLFAGPDDNSRIPGTVGKPVDINVVIGPAPDQALNDGDAGLLWLKGENLMQGYYNNHKATNAVMVNGWLNTGDIAQIENGLISIVGREKLLTNIGGYAVHPQEINEVLLLDAGVTLAYTTTKSDPTYGDYLVSIVAANKGVDKPALTTLCRNNLEPHKVPRYIYIEDTLPIGPSGKVIIDVAEKLIVQQDMQLEQNNTHVTLINLAAKVFNIEATQLSITSGVHNTPGWDSLGHLMLITEIEQYFSILLTPNQIMQIEKLTDFEALVQ